MSFCPKRFFVKAQVSKLVMLLCRRMLVLQFLLARWRPMGEPFLLWPMPRTSCDQAILQHMTNVHLISNLPDSHFWFMSLTRSGA